MKCMHCSQQAAPNSKECDGCWELRTRVQSEPDIAQKFLGMMTGRVTRMGHICQHDGIEHVTAIGARLEFARFADGIHAMAKISDGQTPPCFCCVGEFIIKPEHEHVFEVFRQMIQRFDAKP